MEKQLGQTSVYTEAANLMKHNAIPEMRKDRISVRRRREVMHTVRRDINQLSNYTK